MQEIRSKTVGRTGGTKGRRFYMAVRKLVLPLG